MQVLLWESGSSQHTHFRERQRWERKVPGCFFECGPLGGPSSLVRSLVHRPAGIGPVFEAAEVIDPFIAKIFENLTA
jgi:hypothetical protein